MMTGLVVLKMVLMPSRQRLPSLANSGPRWSIMGVSMARKMRSSSGVGPGIWRKWRPTGREEFLDICIPWRVDCGFENAAPRNRQPACRHELRMRQSVKSNWTGLFGWAMSDLRIASAFGSFLPNGLRLNGVELHE